MHRIGVISDTHGVLRTEVLQILSKCEVILHGGDINHPDILDTLKQFAPVYVVRGNNDKEWAKDIPESLSLELFGVRFFIVHNKKRIPKDSSGSDIIIYGHSHKYEENYIDQQLWLNPGSCGPQRFKLPITMAIVEISTDHTYYVKKIELFPKNKSPKNFEDLETISSNCKEIPQNIKRVIELVIRDTDRRIPIEEIARKNGINQQLAEQICRLYLTHPGVNVEGIMKKMGL